MFAISNCENARRKKTYIKKNKFLCYYLAFKIMFLSNSNEIPHLKSS